LEAKAIGVDASLEHCIAIATAAIIAQGGKSRERPMRDVKSAKASSSVCEIMFLLDMLLMFTL
jgi:hypothetical protein